ncbi:MAG: hypothetical protein LBS64_04835 [Spirochaetaceae bacterium]|jgi:YD repeat-containing protein|nr:hypothetical protein [Spirochaetaceae bacterium]
MTHSRWRKNLQACRAAKIRALLCGALFLLGSGFFISQGVNSQEASPQPPEMLPSDVTTADEQLSAVQTTVEGTPDNSMPDEQIPVVQTPGKQTSDEQWRYETPGAAEFAEEDKTIAYETGGGKLRRAAYLDETFALLSETRSRHAVTGNLAYFVQTRYDEGNHLTSRAVWTSGEDKTVRESLAEYVYSTESQLPSRRVLTNFIAGTREETDFLPNGKESRITGYKVVEEKSELAFQTDFRYDTAGRITERRNVAWMLPGTEPVTETTRYTWTGASKNPDSEFFRNDEPVIKTVYTGENAYVETRYFGLGFQVETAYEDGERISERFLQDGKEKRRS